MTSDAHDLTAGYRDLVTGLRVPMFVVTTAVDGERAGCLVDLEPVAAERRHAGLGVLGSDRVRGLQPGHVA